MSTFYEKNDTKFAATDLKKTCTKQVLGFNMLNLHYLQI
jgi:hypothetical protein